MARTTRVVAAGPAGRGYTRIMTDRRGTLDLGALVAAAGEGGIEAVKQAVVEELQEVIDYAKEWTVPVETGTLRDSGVVGDPEPLPDGGFRVRAGFGGAASEYAVYVHEDPIPRYGGAAKAGTGKGWKYLERPMLAHLPHLREHMVARLRSYLEGMGS